jgi:hypothetical protein
VLHEIIDVIALVAALVGLIPLWRDQQKRMIAVAAACLLLISAGYLLWEYYDEGQKRAEAEVQLSKAEQAITAAACQHPEGMGFDEIYQEHLDYGAYEWALVDQAFGDLVENRTLTIKSIRVPSGTDRNRPVPLRVWSVTDPDRSCRKSQKP